MQKAWYQSKLKRKKYNLLDSANFCRLRHFGALSPDYELGESTTKYQHGSLTEHVWLLIVYFIDFYFLDLFLIIRRVRGGKPEWIGRLALHCNWFFF